MAAHRQGLTLFINRYTRDMEAAEDIAIDVFTYILLYPGKYNFKTSLKTYLYMLGRSRAVDFVRRRARFETVPLEEAQSEAEAAEQSLFAKERQAAVRQAMEKLPREMSEALYLYYFEGLSYEETAKVMKKTKKQIDNLLYRAKERMRDIMGKDGELLL